MKGIRLTPFLLFVILLVVLVIAMIFGYRSNRILENMESDSGLWSVTQNISIATYNSGSSKGVSTIGATVVVSSSSKTSIFEFCEQKVTNVNKNIAYFFI